MSRLSYSDVSRYVAPKKELTKHLRSFLFLMADGSGYHDALPRSIRSQFKNFNMLRVLEIVGLHSLDMEDSEISGKILQSILDLQKLLEAISKLRHLHLLDPAEVLQKFKLKLGGLSKLETLANFNSRYYVLTDLPRP